MARPQEVAVNKIGLTELNPELSPNDALVDIVFVHGLGGHAQGTWTYKGPKGDIAPRDSQQKVVDRDLVNARQGANPSTTSDALSTETADAIGQVDAQKLQEKDPDPEEPPKRSFWKRIDITKPRLPLPSSRSKGKAKEHAREKTSHDDGARKAAAKTNVFFWPQNVPEQCARARVMTFGYDSDVSKFFGGAANQNTFYDHAGDLLGALARKRTQTPDRPMIFVAHSLGGLVVKQMLFDADQSEALPQRRKVYSSTKALFFLGTPHRGSDWTGWGEIARGLAGVVFDTNPTLIKHLRVNSEPLMQLEKHFGSLIYRRTFSVYTFIEAKRFKPLPFLNSKIVNDNYATIGDQGREQIFTLNANHTAMCRFWGKDDPMYEIVAGELKIFVQQSIVQAEGTNVNQLKENPTAAAQIPPSTYKGHYSYSSLRPVPNYVPRPRLHQKIKEQLHDLKDDGMEDVRILVVWGLGGAGKSQLVLNYIRKYRQDYTAVFWIEAGSKESIERDYVQIYRLLSGRQMDAGHKIVKVEDAVPAVKSWFHGREGRWLVVLDSADAIDNHRDKSYIDLRYFMPDAPGVHIVITSRSSTAKEMSMLDAVEVAEMEPSEATELFQRYAKLTEEGLDVIREVDEIVRELGYLALAITLAGSYVSVTARLSSDIRRYLPEYRQWRKKLLQRRAKRHIHQYGESVLSTWEVSFDAIANHSPVAARLLSLLAFINFEDIFLSLFNRDGAGVLASAPSRVAGLLEVTTLSDETWQSFLFSEQQCTVYELESAFETLQSYSLIQRKADQESYAMHKLVHAWGQDRLQADRQQRLSSLALELMADATAKDQIDPSHQLRLVPHVMASFDIFSSLHKSPDELAIERLSIIAGIESFLFKIGRWSEAYKMQVFHFRKIEKMLGKEHPDTLGSMNNLAEVLSIQGKYDEAEEMHRQALALTERILGKEHPNTLTSMNNLALVLSSQGKYEEAEEMHRQALALRERVLGNEHPDTLTSVYCLACLLHQKEQYKDAEVFYHRAYAGYRKTLGETHPTTAACLRDYSSMPKEGKGW